LEKEGTSVCWTCLEKRGFWREKRERGLSGEAHVCTPTVGGLYNVHTNNIKRSKSSILMLKNHMIIDAYILKLKLAGL
jgi:hypothetical protein